MAFLEKLNFNLETKFWAVTSPKKQTKRTQKTWKKTTSKVAHNQPKVFFFNAGNRPQTSANLNLFSIKIAHCTIYLFIMTLEGNAIQNSNKLCKKFQSICSAVASRWAGWALAHPEFGSSVNPITTRGADYAHHITASPPEFENPAASLPYIR